MADLSTTRSAPIAHVPSPSPAQSGTPFSPAAWLTQFEALGGGYALTDKTLHLFVSLTGTTIDDQRRSRRMLEMLTDPKRQAICDYLTGAELQPVQRTTDTSWPASATLAPGMIKLIERINCVCREQRISWSTFGRRALRDPKLVRDLFRGREPRRTTLARVDAYISTMGRA